MNVSRMAAMSARSGRGVCDQGGDWRSQGEDVRLHCTEDDVRRQAHRGWGHRVPVREREPGGQGLIARGIVTEGESIPKKRGVARQTPRVSITVKRTALAKRPLGRTGAQTVQRLEGRPTRDRAQLQVLSTGDQQNCRRFGPGHGVHEPVLLTVRSRPWRRRTTWVAFSDATRSVERIHIPGRARRSPRTAALLRPVAPARSRKCRSSMRPARRYCWIGKEGEREKEGGRGKRRKKKPRAAKSSSTPVVPPSAPGDACALKRVRRRDHPLVQICPAHAERIRGCPWCGPRPRIRQARS